MNGGIQDILKLEEQDPLILEKCDPKLAQKTQIFIDVENQIKSKYSMTKII